MSSPTSSHSETLIIGAGIFGTSTAYHLSKDHERPSGITVIDRTPLPTECAASTDINKIIREDYTQRFYMDLASEALEAWNSWPELKGKDFFHQTGWINLNEKGDDTTWRILENFSQRGRNPSKTISLDEVRTRFGGLFAQTDLSGCDGAYLNPEAGWCDAGAATAELLKIAISRGVNYQIGCVSRLLLNENGTGILGVETSDGRLFTADRVVLCSGAWTSSLLSPIEDALDMGEEDRVERQIVASGVCVAHYALSKEEADLLDQNMPVTIYAHHGDAQPPPSLGPGPRLLKMTNALAFTNPTETSSGHVISVPPDRPQDVVSEKLKAETCRFMTHPLFPQLTRDREVHSWRLCWDAISPSQDHLITKHPDRRLTNLFIATGGSFHSYKFLPTIGKYIVNVLQGRSNGDEKDAHWAWKTARSQGRGAHEKAYPTRPLRELEG